MKSGSNKVGFRADRLAMEDLTQMLALRKQGMSIKQVAEALNVPYGRAWYVLSKTANLIGRRQLTWRRWDERFGFNFLSAYVEQYGSYLVAARRLGLCPRSFFAYLEFNGMKNIPIKSGNGNRKATKAQPAARKKRPFVNGKIRENIELLFKRLTSEDIMNSRVRDFKSLDNFSQYYRISSDMFLSELKKRGWSLRPSCRQKKYVFNTNHAIRVYRRCESVSWTAKQMNADLDTVRSALREAGVLLTDTERCRLATDRYLLEKIRRIAAKTKLDKKMLEDYPNKERAIYLIDKARHLARYHRNKQNFVCEFVNRFLTDPTFISVYCYFREQKSELMLQPSVDHVLPVSRGGSHECHNLQFLTWIENRHKEAMTMDEWVAFRAKTATDSDWYTDRIVDAHKWCRRPGCRLVCKQKTGLAIEMRIEANA